MVEHIGDYDYDLPKELIAQQPLPSRSDARMLIVNRETQQIDHAHVRDLAEYLAPGDSLVLNNSKVVPARLLGRRTLTNGRWQGLFLRADDAGNWRLLCKTRGKLKPGEVIQVLDHRAEPAFKLRMLAKQEDGVWAAHVDLSDWSNPDATPTPWELLEHSGHVPLPPYIRGGVTEPGDLKRYQTVYADPPGSVAAPTAGLHLTQPLLEQLQGHGVDSYFLTLHVGIGTFRPIAVEELHKHRMHSEFGEITPQVSGRLLQTREAGGRIVAVGTTSVGVLESAASSGKLQAWSGETDLFIRPPYEFKAVDALLTNFHLPRSTLLVLVRTFGGDALIRRAYEEAVEQRYRFFSYGDAMLIL